MPKQDYPDFNLLFIFDLGCQDASHPFLLKAIAVPHQPHSSPIVKA